MIAEESWVVVLRKSFAFFDDSLTLGSCILRRGFQNPPVIAIRFLKLSSRGDSLSLGDRGQRKWRTTTRLTQLGSTNHRYSLATRDVPLNSSSFSLSFAVPVKVPPGFVNVACDASETIRVSIIFGINFIAEDQGMTNFRDILVCTVSSSRTLVSRPRTRKAFYRDLEPQLHPPKQRELEPVSRLSLRLSFASMLSGQLHNVAGVNLP